MEGWLRGRDLNPRPLGYEPNELPDCSTPHCHSSRAWQSCQLVADSRSSRVGKALLLGCFRSCIVTWRGNANSVRWPRRCPEPATNRVKGARPISNSGLNRKRLLKTSANHCVLQRHLPEQGQQGLVCLASDN